MKRIIDGVTYNTDTSALLGQKSGETLYGNLPYPCLARLYQTRGGAFFVHEIIDLGPNDEGVQTRRDRAEALSATKAAEWLIKGDVEVFHNPFSDPPEATAESEPAATIYVRVPISLKQRLEQSAKAQKLSGNSWAIRCIEQCLSGKEVSGERAAIGEAWWLARTIEQNFEGYPVEILQKFAERIGLLIEDYWEELGFLVDDFSNDTSNLASSNNYSAAVNDIVRDASSANS